MNIQPGQLPLKSLTFTSSTSSKTKPTSSETEPTEDKNEEKALVSVRAQAGRQRRGGALPQPRAEPIVVPNQVAAMPIVMTGFVTLVPHTVLDAIALTNCRQYSNIGPPLIKI